MDIRTPLFTGEKLYAEHRELEPHFSPQENPNY